MTDQAYSHWIIQRETIIQFQFSQLFDLFQRSIKLITFLNL